MSLSGAAPPDILGKMEGKWLKLGRKEKAVDCRKCGG